MHDRGHELVRAGERHLPPAAVRCDVLEDGGRPRVVILYLGAALRGHISLQPLGNLHRHVDGVNGDPFVAIALDEVQNLEDVFIVRTGIADEDDLPRRIWVPVQAAARGQPFEHRFGGGLLRL